jgi:hypothetical protein
MMQVCRAKINTSDIKIRNSALDFLLSFFALGGVGTPLTHTHMRARTHARTHAHALAFAELWHFLGCAQFLHGAFDVSASAHGRAAELLLASDADAEEVADELVRRGTSLLHGAASAVEGLDTALSEYDRALSICPGHVAASTQRAAAFWERVRVVGQTLPRSELVVLVPYRTVTLPASPERGGSAVPNPLHSAHCMHWATRDDCAKVVAAAEASGAWQSARHTDYATVDIDVSTVRSLHEWLVPRLQSTLLPTMANLFGVPLCRLAARDVFVVKYGVPPTRASVAKGPVGLVGEGWWVVVVDGVLRWLMVGGGWWMAVVVVVA